MISNLWVLCKGCNFWHLKIVNCPSKKVRKRFDTEQLLEAVWAYSEIAFVDPEVTEIYILPFQVIYLRHDIPDPNVILAIALHEFKTRNSRALQYVCKND